MNRYAWIALIVVVWLVVRTMAKRRAQRGTPDDPVRLDPHADREQLRRENERLREELERRRRETP